MVLTEDDAFGGLALVTAVAMEDTAVWELRRFLANYPEALSSSVGMSRQGISFGRILGIWTALMLITGLGAAIGSQFSMAASPHACAFIEGLAAGAMLTMIAETMLPEPYIKGGSVIGLSTLFGFLVAIFSKTLDPVATDAAHDLGVPTEEARQEMLASADSRSLVLTGVSRGNKAK
jgi:hypothetical protein